MHREDRIALHRQILFEARSGEIEKAAHRAIDEVCSEETTEDHLDKMRLASYCVELLARIRELEAENQRLRRLLVP